MILYIELNMMMNPKLLCPYEWHRTAFAKPKHILRLPFVCYFSTWCHLNSVQQLNFEFVASIFTNNFASWFSFGRVFPHPLLSLHYTNSLKFSLRFTSAICNEYVCVSIRPPGVIWHNVQINHLKKAPRDSCAHTRETQ